ncbi:MFS transporter [Alicyclobacillus sp. SO9]|uniref:MDR family MFS transporter n=1 Tax=Alicyclobacillus sp. SO9 TaxID=2665646 RepID=UPI0018E805C8|nr:MFS transporter [Alicyclobacillus sp. SO9]QQE80147.1 MFS transporter [Alicyclobacillus sp. SO9]
MRFTDLHRNVKIRIYVLFAFGTVQATTMPFMAIYFAQNLGEALTGILLTMSIVASMFSGMLGGFYADRFGRKKLMVGSEAVFLLAYLVMAFANSPWLHSPSLTFAMFLFTNVCWGIYGPADEAMLIDVTTSESRPFVYSIFYWVWNLTMAVGASIGAVLFEHYRFFLFTAMSIVLLGTLLTTIFKIEETFHPNHVIHPGAQGDVETNARRRFSFKRLLPNGILKNYASVMKDTTFVKYIFAGMLVMAVEFQLSNYIGIHFSKDIVHQSLIHIKNFHIWIDGVKMLGFLQTENTIIVVLLASIAVRIVNRYPDRRVLFFSILLNTVGYSFMIVVNAPWVLMGLMVIATIGEISSVPIRQTYLGDIAPSAARSSYVAANGLTFDGSQIMASLGVMLGAVVSPWMMAALSLASGIGGFLLFYSIVPAVHRRRKQNDEVSVQGDAGSVSL